MKPVSTLSLIAALSLAIAAVAQTTGMDSMN